MTDKSGKRKDLVRNIFFTVCILGLIFSSLSPLTRAQLMMRMSLTLQDIARRTGETAIKLELGAYKEVNT